MKAINNSLFINNNGVQLTTVSLDSFKHWLITNVNSQFKTPKQTIEKFLKEKYNFVKGVNKIGLKSYYDMYTISNDLLSIKANNT
jgi:hypothetical protein